MSVCKRCFVDGRVQGVFYRASTAEKAAKWNVTGYAHNLDDGRVEVLACGREEDVDMLVEWLHHGPKFARVKSVEIHDADDAPPASFSTTG
ncbi:MAG: acylphosphatase [Gammaproteobacteria bacterium]|nr:acylphosphatase [Gammaproteobacteria bacterium]